MAELCSCGTGGGNLGRPSCYPIFDVTKQLILVQYYKTDGSINGIDLSTLTAGVLDQSFLDARIRDTVSSTRWYPTPELKNITDERAEDITEEFEDTSSVFIQQGARAFAGSIIKGDPVLLGNLKKWKCLTIGVFFIDKSGNLIGKQSRDGFLDPILLQDESFSAGLVKGTDTTKQKNSLSFIVSQLEDDADMKMIEGSNITASLLGVGGLVDVVSAGVTSISTAGFTVQLNTNFGGIGSEIEAEGMVVADFAANELSPTPGVVSLSTVIESSITPGEYAFLFSGAATSGDVIQISNTTVSPLTKPLNLVNFTVTIP